MAESHDVAVYLHHLSPKLIYWKGQKRERGKGTMDCDNVDLSSFVGGLVRIGNFYFGKYEALDVFISLYT
jgi:hypothetical protein